jgi:predicted enzyme related to lactoylglutathione lyase
MPNAIVHFEIPADDVERARRFYEAAFGWKISDPWNMDYFIVETRKPGEAGINGGLMQRKMPGQPFMNYIATASIEDSLARVEMAGGTVCLPKTEIGAGMGWIAAFQDTEGNLMGFHEPPPPTKRATRKAPAKKKSTRKAAKKKK